MGFKPVHRLPFLPNAGHRPRRLSSSSSFEIFFQKIFLVYLARSLLQPSLEGRRTVPRGRWKRSLKSLRFFQLLGISSTPSPFVLCIPLLFLSLSLPLTHWSCVISHAFLFFSTERASAKTVGRS